MVMVKVMAIKRPKCEQDLLPDPTCPDDISPGRGRTGTRPVLISASLELSPTVSFSGRRLVGGGEGGGELLLHQ